ncbi:MAG: ATP-binding protein, partial [Acetobacteraceae bacterium]
ESIEDAERAIAQSGDAMAISALEAEMATESPSEVAGKLEATLAEHKERQIGRDQLLLKKQDSEREFAHIHGQDDAAGAESERQMAIAQMTGAIERYMTLQIGARMLRWAIDRYREEKQDPLLKRAGQIFAAITLESYNGLTVDFDGDKPLLKGRRANGKHVGVEALSSGTRDQLFLALRIAALEQHLESGGNPLPFIADDLFINFDDQRTAAAFGVLSELAARTQVIYLTHHTHLASIARSRIGQGLHMVDISDGVSTGDAPFLGGAPSPFPQGERDGT